MKPSATDLLRALLMFRAAPYDAVTVFADDLHEQIPPGWCVTGTTQLEYADLGGRWTIVVDQARGLITCQPAIGPRRPPAHSYSAEPAIAAAAAVALQTKGPQYDPSLKLAYLTRTHSPNIFVLQFSNRAWVAYTGDLVRWINANMRPTVCN